mmetsp:Transcript_64383/g.153562  ORF Transcript_64383/g.153562 Transcript_64383/m.153562 type:complete len:477 (-) Transcript_64383:31-1461(-)
MVNTRVRPAKPPPRCREKPKNNNPLAATRCEFGVKSDLPALSICRLEAPEELLNTWKQHVDDPALAEFACPICLEPFWQPVRTVCGHAFCEGCLLKSVLTQLSQGTIDVSCPLCRHLLHVDDVTVDQALLTKIRLILNEKRRAGTQQTQQRAAAPSSQRLHHGLVTPIGFTADSPCGVAGPREALQRPHTSGPSFGRQKWQITPRRPPAPCGALEVVPAPVSRASPAGWPLPGSRPSTTGGGRRSPRLAMEPPLHIDTSGFEEGLEQQLETLRLASQAPRCGTAPAASSSSAPRWQYRQQPPPVSTTPHPPHEMTPRAATPLRSLSRIRRGPSLDDSNDADGSQLTVDARLAQLCARPSSSMRHTAPGTEHAAAGAGAGEAVIPPPALDLPVASVEEPPATAAVQNTAARRGEVEMRPPTRGTSRGLPEVLARRRGSSKRGSGSGGSAAVPQPRVLAWSGSSMTPRSATPRAAATS